jgi:heme/copper-type cytochrome/quinol oxidase subunit 1
MERYSQVSITIGTLGVVITLIGLFPGIAGLETTEGVGVLQVLIILLGFTLLFTGAYIFAKQMFFSGLPSTLAQDIGVRLTMSGLLFSAAAGLADVLGFGSHAPTATERPLLGDWQAVAFIGGFLIASSGIVIFVLFGPEHPESSSEDTTQATD